MEFGQCFVIQASQKVDLLIQIQVGDEFFQPLAVWTVPGDKEIEPCEPAKVERADENIKTLLRGETACGRDVRTGVYTCCRTRKFSHVRSIANHL